jgi:hypothetical protein
MHWRGVIPGPTRAVVFLLPIAIILLVLLMRIGVHAMANVGGRYASLDILHAEPDLSATLLVNRDVANLDHDIGTSKLNSYG